MESLLSTGACRTDLPFFTNLAFYQPRQNERNARPLTLQRSIWEPQVPVSLIAIERARSESRNDLETLKTLVIFCGVGLVFSMFLAANGWI